MLLAFCVAAVAAGSRLGRVTVAAALAMGDITGDSRTDALGNAAPFGSPGNVEWKLSI